MAAKPKSRPKSKRKPRTTDSKQSERLETALVGADESGEAFKRAFEKIVPPKGLSIVRTGK
jgi:hypothetical protein